LITDYSKQSELIKAHEHKDKRINIIGCGATGSWLAFFLLKMGFENIHIYDFDIIEEHNIPNQLFREKDIGKPKVDAFMEIYKESFNDSIDRIKIHNTKITEENAVMLSGLILNAVDSMSARKFIYEKCFKYGRADFLCESRLSIWGAYIYTLRKDEEFKWYEDTLYADEEAEVSSCGISQTGLPAAINAASMIIMQLICYLRGETNKPSIQYSIPDLVVC
jgi:molybdopterin/thiamine biosynthesis adenylyltransferase